MLKSMLSLILAAVLLMIGCDELREAIDEGAVNDPTNFSPIGTLQSQQRFGDYIVRIHRDMVNGNGSLEISKAGRRVYARTGHRFGIGSIYEDEKKESLISIGTDITGDGQPNLVVSEWTGGAHCCCQFYVFEIGEAFRFLGVIDAGHGDGSDFADLDGDANLEFVGCDWTFAYWYTSFADSPAPTIILRYSDGRYRFAMDLMRKPAPSAEALERGAAVIRRDKKEWERFDRPPSYLWGTILDLIYEGNENSAWQFFDLAWPKDVGGKKKFAREFRAQLKRSPYWPEVRQLNPGR